MMPEQFVYGLTAVKQVEPQHGVNCSAHLFDHGYEPRNFFHFPCDRVLLSLDNELPHLHSRLFNSSS